MVTPGAVSGRRVAVGKVSPSPSAKYISVHWPMSGSLSSFVSWAPTGMECRGHHPTGCLPLTMRPLFLSFSNCHWMKRWYSGSTVVNSLVQSMPRPNLSMALLDCWWKYLARYSGSPIFLISSSGTP